MTDKEKQEIAEKIGRAYRTGKELGELANKIAAEIDEIISRGEVTDEAEWITVHPNGANHPGQHCLVDKTAKVVLGGLGGKFTGLSLGKAFRKAIGKALKKRRNQKTAPKKDLTEENSSSSQNQQQPKKTQEVKTQKINGDTPIPEGYADLERVSLNGSLRLNQHVADYYHKATEFKGRIPSPGNKYKPRVPGDKTYEALRHYSHKGDEAMNRLLRSRDGINSKDADPKIIEEIKTISSYMDKHRAKKPMTLFRGMSDPEKAKEFIKTGTYQDPGFTSTSTSYGSAHKFATPTSENDRYFLILRTPKNYGAVSLYNRSISKHQSEHEILLQKGSKGAVQKVEQRPDPTGAKGNDFYIYIKLDEN